MSSPNSPEVYLPTKIYSPETSGVVYYTRPKPRYWLHGVLLLLTIFTTLIVGSRLEWNYLSGLPSFSADDDIFPSLCWAFQGHHLLLGIPFSLTLMLILLAHEMGHYFHCLRYRVAATPPFFIPFPTLFGTMGAFIRIRSPLPSRKVLFDIGIAGPIAGFAVAFPALLLSLGLSHVAPSRAAPPAIEFGFPLVFLLAQHLLAVSGSAIAHAPMSHLYLHPVAVAAWVGMFATALNLLPGGQLDGGHIVFAVFPRAHRTISNLTILALIPLAVYFWTGWLIWAILLRISGARHPELPMNPDITRGRRWLAISALIMLILTFTPAPIIHGSLFDALQQFHSSR
jgi:membrane-associated protease RseP (regulator of RpoE activity)